MQPTVTLEDNGKDKVVVKGPRGSRRIDTRPLTGESEKETASRLAKIVAEAVEAVTDPSSESKRLSLTMGMKGQDRLLIEATASAVLMKQAKRITVEEYGENKHLVKGPLGSRLVSTRRLLGEPLADWGSRVESIFTQAALAVGDPSVNPDADLDALMGIKSNSDRLPIEATASGISFRAAAPADLVAYKRHYGYGGN